MGWWSDIRDIVIPTVALGPIGGVLGLGYDSATGKGLFKNEPYQVDSSGRPLPPEYQPGYNTNLAVAPTLGGNLDSNKALQNIDKEGARTGRSRWANASMQEQEREGTIARDRAARTAGAAAADSRTQLAMRGGLSGGAKERIAQSTASDVLNLNQNVSEAQMGNMNQIGINDEQNRLNAMQTAGQMGMQKAQLKNQANQFDISNTIDENRAKNSFNLDAYNGGMKEWAAGQNANAIQQAGKK